MPSVKCEGLDEVLARLKAMGRADAMEGVQKRAVYKAMAVIRQETEAQIRALPTQEGYVKPENLPRDVITEKEKQELIRHIGFSKMALERGAVTDSLSFDGYTSIKTKKYPNGVPAVLIARSINSGSSVRAKHPFMRQAKAAAKARAIAAATEEGIAALNELMEE